MKWRLLPIAAALAAIPGSAFADPVTLISGAAAWAASSGVITAFQAFLISTGASLIAAADARRKARKAAARARAEYNAGLQDRNVTVLMAEPPRRTVYGRAIVGGDVFGIFTSDKTTYNSKGQQVTKPDAYNYLVISYASHKSEAIHEVYIQGEAVGALDGNGVATDAKWQNPATKTAVRNLTFTTSITTDAPITTVLACWEQVAADNAVGYVQSPVTPSYTPGGTTITAGSGQQIWAQVVLAGDNSTVRIIKHLGDPAQTVDTMLSAAVPTEWTSNHRLRGITYIVVRLDLEDQRFQGGPPNITVDLSGKLVYDPRTTNTVWSDNPALCIRDFLTSSDGYAVSAADIDDASIIAAANVCEEQITLQTWTWKSITLLEVQGDRYVCNGSTSTDQNPEAVIEELAQAMAGEVTYGAKWQAFAGKWVAPVMSLGDDDLDGQIDVLQVGAGLDEIFNGVRASYIQSGQAVPVDMHPPYQNSAYVTADGEELWVDEAYPWTDNATRCRQLARVKTERARYGLVIRYPAKLKAWPLQVNDRVSITSAEYGWSGKTFRVTDWAFGIDAPVILTLQEDVSTIYDAVDAGIQGPNEVTGLPDPRVVPKLANFALASGATHALVQADGNIVPRIWASWDAVTGPYIADGSGYIVVRWIGSVGVWEEVQVSGGDTGTYLTGVAIGTNVMVEAWAVNGIGARGESVAASHLVTGPSGLIRVGGGNLLVNSSFERYSGAGGLAEGWSAYSAGQTGSVTPSLDSDRVYGSLAQLLSSTALGTTGNDRAGVRQQVVSALLSAAQITFSAHAKANVNSTIALSIDYYNGGSYITSSYTSAVATGAWQRVGMSVTAPDGTTNLFAYVWQERNTSQSAAALRVDGALLQLGAQQTSWAPSIADLLPRTYIQSTDPAAVSLDGDDWFDTDDRNKHYVRVSGAWSAVRDVAATNFDARNDRNATAVVAPTIAGDGTAIDHTISTDGAANVSFEWLWGGVEADIDGFIVYVRQSTSASAYTIGSAPAEEVLSYVSSSKRSMIYMGVAADMYYTFGVRAYRVVDPDVNAAGVLFSSVVQPGLGAENPYRPASSVSFSGNVTGTVNNIAATDVNVWDAVTGTGKPTDNATADNLLPPIFAGRWTPYSARATIVAGGAGDTSPYLLRFGTGGTGDDAIFYSGPSAPSTGGVGMMRCEPGETYRNAFRLTSSGTTATNFYCAVQYLLKDNTLSSTNFFRIISSGFPTGWTEYVDTIVVPANAVGMWVRFGSDDLTAGAFWVERPTLVKVIATGQIADGAVTDAKVANLSADKITTGSLRGISVQAGSFITRGSYAVGAVSGGATTITLKDTNDFHASGGTACFIDTQNDYDQFTYTGKNATQLTGCSSVSAHTDLAAVVPLINNGAYQKTVVIERMTGDLRIWDNRGDGVYDWMVRVGVQASGSSGGAVFGSIGSTSVGVTGMTDTGNGVIGVSSSSGNGGNFYSTGAGFGLRCAGNSTRANALMYPMTGRPSDRTAGAFACINTTGGTTDNRSATPRLFYADGTDWRYVYDNTVFNG